MFKLCPFRDGCGWYIRVFQTCAWVLWKTFKDICWKLPSNRLLHILHFIYVTYLNAFQEFWSTLGTPSTFGLLFTLNLALPTLFKVQQLDYKKTSLIFSFLSSLLVWNSLSVTNHYRLWLQRFVFPDNKTVYLYICFSRNNTWFDGVNCLKKYIKI